MAGTKGRSGLRLPPEKVSEIQKLKLAGVTTSSVAEQFSVDRTTVNRIWERARPLPENTDGGAVKQHNSVGGVTGRKLRALRYCLGLTQAKLGSRLKVTGFTVCDWEVGRKPIPSTHKRKIELMIEDAPVTMVAGKRVVIRMADAPSVAGIPGGPRWKM